MLYFQQRHIGQLEDIWSLLLFALYYYLLFLYCQQIINSFYKHYFIVGHYESKFIIIHCIQNIYYQQALYNNYIFLKFNCLYFAKTSNVPLLQDFFSFKCYHKFILSTFIVNIKTYLKTHIYHLYDFQLPFFCSTGCLYEYCYRQNI